MGKGSLLHARSPPRPLGAVRCRRGARSPHLPDPALIGPGTAGGERLFIDTSAFYALEDASDEHHGEALAIQRWCLRRRPLLFTSHHVLDESVTLIGARLDPGRAVRFARSLLASRVIQIVRTDEVLEQAALNVYQRLNDGRVSFTDCLSFAVMRALDIPVAFAFDRHFARAGFRRAIPP
jgi:predicted nucleic acid-binding protein